jgi:hypothetical protein
MKNISKAVMVTHFEYALSFRDISPAYEILFHSNYAHYKIAHKVSFEVSMKVIENMPTNEVRWW